MLAALHDRFTVTAERRHVERRSAAAFKRLVIQGAREDAGSGGLADPAHAREHVGLRDTAAFERVRKRADHCVLADQLAEGGGAVFAGEDAIAGVPGTRDIGPRAGSRGGAGGHLGCLRRVAHSCARFASGRAGRV